MKINGLTTNNNMFDKMNIGDKIVEKKEVSFIDTLKEKLNEVNDKQIEAENVTEQFVKGEGSDIHEVMLATEEAKMSLELAVQIRNKIVEAYQEITRMQM
jgi:flagellar hook-basal body complex protein FliE